MVGLLGGAGFDRSIGAGLEIDIGRRTSADGRRADAIRAGGDRPVGVCEPVLPLGER